MKKNAMNKNNAYGSNKKIDFIYPNLKTKYLKGNNDFLKFLNRKEFTDKYIYSKAKNKNDNIKKDLYKINSRKINLSLPKKVKSYNKVFNVKKNIFTQLSNNKNNNKNHYSSETYNSATYINDDIKERINKMIISKENNIFIERKKDYSTKKYKRLEVVDKMWNSLYIPYSYRELFNVILFQIDDEEEKNKLIENEFNELNELINDIEALLYNIKMRKEIISELKEMNNRLRLIFKTESEESNFKLVMLMSNKIEKMREYTINICLYMKKIKNKIYEGKHIGKYDLDIISNQFKFDENYLIKMKEEMIFLKDGYAKYFFNITEDRSPFLVKASEEDPNANGDPFIHLVPMSKEINNKIQKCNYIIYQELIAYQNKDFKDNKFRPISPLRNYNIYDCKNIDLNTTTFKRFNSNLTLKPIKDSSKNAIFESDFISQFPKIENNNNKNLLKENSCMNLDIKNILVKKKSNNNLMSNIKNKEKKELINKNENNL